MKLHRRSFIRYDEVDFAVPTALTFTGSASFATVLGNVKYRPEKVKLSMRTQ